MLRPIFIAVVITTTVVADFEPEWTVFKAKYKKVYTPTVDEIRKYIWIENKKFVDEHNKLYSQGLSSFYMGENEFSDMTTSEFVTKYTGMKMDDSSFSDTGTTESLPSFGLSNHSLPVTVDWRKEGFVTPVRNQGPCGSCWAFSATGAIEGQHFKSTGKLVSLSQSNLLDCAGDKYDNFGCMGGTMDHAFKYVIDNKGIDTETSYPYLPIERFCNFNRSNVGATISGYKDIVPKGSEAVLQQAVAEVGPISASIYSGLASFKNYQGGVYDDPMCRATLKSDHAVLLVGYGRQGEADYWLVKNSWGTSWGEDGYVMMSRNEYNQCGIANMASYPII